MAAANQGDRPRLSWSEIDKRKDRSGGSGGKRGGSERRDEKSSPQTISKYKQRLEQLFAPAQKTKSKLAKPVKDALQNLREITDRGEFQTAADAYLAEFGMPAAWEDLQDFMRHKNPEVLKDVIGRMEALLADQNDVRKGNFQKDLHLIEMTTRDKDLRKLAADILKKLS